MPLNKYLYCVVVTFKMTEWVQQWICIKFCVKLEHSATETLLVIQKAKAMGNWWLAASSQQCTCSCLMSHGVFWQNSLPIAQIWCPVASGLSQNWNSLWKGRDFRPSMRFRKIRWGSWWQLREQCEVPGCLLWRGLRHHCPMYSVSCILYLLQ